MGTHMDDEASDPKSNKNAKGKELCLEDPELEERGYHAEITYTEASEDFLFEEVATLVYNIFLYTFEHCTLFLRGFINILYILYIFFRCCLRPCRTRSRWAIPFF